MKVTNLLAARVTNDVAQPPRVISLRSVFWIPNHFVDEIAEVEHEAESLIRRSPLVFPDHPAVGRRGALLHVLAAHEGESHRPAILIGRRRDRATDPAAEAMLVSKAIPVNVSWLEAGCERAAGPVTLGGKFRFGDGHDPIEVRIIGDLDRQLPRLGARRRRPASPQDHTIRMRIAGSDALGIKIPSLTPHNSGISRISRSPGQASAERGGHLHELPPCN